MIEETFSVFIHCPPEAVFAILTDFESYLARWAKGPVAAKRTSIETGLGSVYKVTARVGPIRVSSPYVVRVWEPPEQFAGSGTA